MANRAARKCLKKNEEGREDMIGNPVATVGHEKVIDCKCIGPSDPAVKIERGVHSKVFENPSTIPRST
jgi:hypothetical protein